ncbi:hypothetical protein ATCC90586_011178 [Pythium insidiosum]|nr:hypothetical protein ATCC90586_011178 [Pythium insidiosum]
MNKTGKFAIRGFPYKLGFLLHGPPGTGKTSLIKAIAQHTKRHIVTINLSKIRTNQELLDAVFDLKFSVEDMDYPISLSFKDVVFVMEDIDCASRIVEKRDNSDSKYEQKRESRVERMVESQKKAEMDDDDDDMPGLIGPMPKPKDTSNDKLNLSEA